jgi:hypothetical protein
MQTANPGYEIDDILSLALKGAIMRKGVAFKDVPAFIIMLVMKNYFKQLGCTASCRRTMERPV